MGNEEGRRVRGRRVGKIPARNPTHPETSYPNLFITRSISPASSKRGGEGGGGGLSSEGLSLEVVRWEPARPLGLRHTHQPPIRSRGVEQLCMCRRLVQEVNDSYVHE